MLFSSSDYPLFLIAVFFLYALSREGGALQGGARKVVRALLGEVTFLVLGRWARVAVLVLLGDFVFLLVSKDPATLWDPLGGALYRLAAHDTAVTWPVARLALQWPIGLCAVGGGIALGVRRGGWIGSELGQRWIARGIVVTLAVVGAGVAIASAAGPPVLDDLTAVLTAHGHLLVLVVLGIGIGAAQHDTHRPLGRIVILFVASSLFYHAWAAANSGPYRYLLAVLLGTIVLDYYLAIWIENAESPAKRKALLVVSLCSNLGILCFFKYTNFLTQDVLHLPVSKLHLILPAGISFHTFQSLSYTIDVYRKQLKATRSVVQFATFVLFFPQLVAGPIVRAQDLLPQLSDLPAMDMTKATRGVFRILVGLFKKIALADTLARAIADRVFEAPERFSGLEVLIGVYAYALVIYLDFSAYSDIAIGSAGVLGFELPENFRTPYRSGNLQEFWRRWHISLSTWLRDYLYVTLGGSRGAPWRTYVNLAVTMLLGGLWHGASWTFIVWGALHGFGLAITRFFQRQRGGSQTAVTSMFVWCATIAAAGVGIEVFLVPSGTDAWAQLVFMWVVLTPLWAVLTAWLGEDAPEAIATGAPRPLRDPAELLRIAMCVSGVGLLAALHWGETALWIPLGVMMWGLALAGDVTEYQGRLDVMIARMLRRLLAVVLVFHYVCLAWVFFRATSFDNALAVLERIAGLRLGAAELDHANLVPRVMAALAVGLLCHFFAEGSFRWLRERFVALPAWGQGIVLASATLVLRELAEPKIVPFIYFQF